MQTILFLYCAANSIDKLQEGIQECVTEIQEWYNKNRLVINVSKSNIMVVCTRQRETHTNVHDFNVFLGNDIETLCHTFDFLLRLLNRCVLCIIVLSVYLYFSSNLAVVFI